jgi:hypothetical protein
MMSAGSYTVVGQANVCQVLKHWIMLEERKHPSHANTGEKLSGWLDLEDSQLLARMRTFADERGDVNPILTWTVGTRGNKHYERVRRWVLAQVSLAALYSCGINDSMKGALDAVRGNLASFVVSARKYPEFRLGDVPEGDFRIIIVVAQSQVDRDGTLEVVDGAHRAVTMLANGLAETTAFLAEL